MTVFIFLGLSQNFNSAAQLRDVHLNSVTEILAINVLLDLFTIELHTLEWTEILFENSSPV